LEAIRRDQNGGAEVGGSNVLHGGQTLMAWAVGNARVEPRGNAIIITKQASGTAKIDPPMAAFNAIAWMASNPASTQPSIYWL
jgi:phage terminase large subunit-like protein